MDHPEAVSCALRCLFESQRIVAGSVAWQNEYQEDFQNGKLERRHLDQVCWNTASLGKLVRELDRWWCETGAAEPHIEFHRVICGRICESYFDAAVGISEQAMATVHAVRAWLASLGESPWCPLSGDSTARIEALAEIARAAEHAETIKLVHVGLKHEEKYFVDRHEVQGLTIRDIEKRFLKDGEKTGRRSFQRLAKAGEFGEPINPGDRERAYRLEFVELALLPKGYIDKLATTSDTRRFDS